MKTYDCLMIETNAFSSQGEDKGLSVIGSFWRDGNGIFKIKRNVSHLKKIA